jgi:hypothetical protein
LQGEIGRALARFDGEVNRLLVGDFPEHQPLNWIQHQSIGVGVNWAAQKLVIFS